MWEQPKLLLPYTITRLSAFYDTSDLHFVNVTTGGFGVTLDEQQVTMKYITGLLNSRLLNWFLKKVSTTFHGGYFAANKQFLIQLPIRTINFSDPTDKAHHTQVVELVERMLSLQKKLTEARMPRDKEIIQQQLTLTDRQIDRLVYELYGLTEEEINLVEGKLQD